MNSSKTNIETLCTHSDKAELVNVRSFVLDNAKKFGFDEIMGNKIALAVDEACSNLIKHAYKFDPARYICVEIATENSSFIVKIIDDGKSFDPSFYPIPDMNDYFKKYKHGGLGIHIIRLIMDDIKYYPSNEKNPRNILELKKNLN